MKEKKVKKLTSHELGTENVRWDLSVFYSSLDDPQLDKDIQTYVKNCKEFHRSFKGRLDTKLGNALDAYRELAELSNQFGVYLFLRSSVDVNDEAVKTKQDEVDTLTSEIAGEFLTFFDLEIIALSENELQKQIKSNPVVAHHKPFLEDIRKDKPYVLSEEVETILTQISPFGPSSWGQYYDEVAANLKFSFESKDKSLTEMLDVLSENTDAAVRADALNIINTGLQNNFTKLSAQSLNTIVGSKRFFDKKRGYKHSMSVRNRNNKVSDDVVDALHVAVEKKAVPLALHYYRLKGAHLGIKPLAWSDRNASIPFSDTTVTPYPEALQMVVNAYEGFSPTLAKIIKDIVAVNGIDAPFVSGKMDGAYNCSIVLPGSKSLSFTFLNYLGSNRDVMTLAHELGHGVHGVLAGGEQGILMQHPGMIVCETASVFGEMTIFNTIKEKLISAGDKKALLAHIMGKLDDMINTAVRQINFSFFEQAVHGAGRRLSPKELNDVWVEQTKRMYGKEGDVFTYKNIDALWSYVGHFHRPFYVYSYAFGEFLTHSLYAQQKRLGDKFEPLYLDMLKAGDSKNVTELLEPFGLDPADPEFWNKGIDMSIGALLKEAEDLSRDLGVTI